MSEARTPQELLLMDEKELIFLKRIDVLLCDNHRRNMWSSHVWDLSIKTMNYIGDLEKKIKDYKRYIKEVLNVNTATEERKIK